MLRAWTRDPGVARCEHGQLAAVDIKVNLGEVLSQAPQAPAHDPVLCSAGRRWRAAFKCCDCFNVNKTG